MPYQGESYRQQTGVYCERCHKLTGNKYDDHRSRIVVISCGNSNDAYICTSCTEEIVMFQTCQINYSGKSMFHLSRDGMLSYMVPGGGRRGKVNPDDLRNTMSRYESDVREMLGKIRRLEGKYTNRNDVVDDLKEAFKNIFNAVELYLQKT